MVLPADQGVAIIFVSSLFYGLYLTTFFNCVRWLVFTDEGWKIRKNIGWTNLTITLIICILTTITKSLDLSDIMVRVVRDVNPKPPPPGEVGSATRLSWITVVNCTNANVTTLLADAVLIYRCWVIYNRRHRVIVLSVFLWIGGLMLTGLQAYWQIVRSAAILKAWKPLNMTIGPGTVLTPFWGSTIILNGYSTFMIARRIYKVSERSKDITSVDGLRFAMRVLIESGFLYLVTGIAHFVVWWTPSAYAISIISIVNVTIIGIAFNLILIRVAQRRVEDSRTSSLPDMVSEIQFKVPGVKNTTGLFQTVELPETDSECTRVVDATSTV